MPTIHREDGWRFVVYPNDHPPAHIHVIDPDWTVVVNIANGVEIRTVIGDPSPRDVRRVLELIVEHRPMLALGWRDFHGEN